MVSKGGRVTGMGFQDGATRNPQLIGFGLRRVEGGYSVALPTRVLL
jgi:hypothetical protein